MHLIRRDDNSSYNSNTHYRSIIRLTQTNLIAETNLIRMSNLTELYVAPASNKLKQLNSSELNSSIVRRLAWALEIVIITPIV